MNTQPIIFLDFDGVLNSLNYFVKGREKKLKSIRAGTYKKEDKIDTNAIKHLNSIVAATGAHVVVTSTWRKRSTVKELQALLKFVGFSGIVIDKTKDLSHFNGLRGNEILEWTKANNVLVGPYHEYINYVILDDDSDMLYWQRNNFIKINGKTGLTKYNARRAIKIINRKQRQN